MAMKKCKECGAEISSSAKVCPNCGKKQKKPIGIIIFVIIIILIVIACAGGSSSDNNNSTSSTEANVEKDMTYVIYEDENFLFKITSYEYSDIWDSLEVSLYIENNSDTDTEFTIDGDISVNGYMIDGGYFYQQVNAGTKANTSFTLYNLEDNGINESNLSTMSFKVDIYQSSNYYINNRIVDDLQITYEF